MGFWLRHRHRHHHLPIVSTHSGVVWIQFNLFRKAASEAEGNLTLLLHRQTRMMP